MGLWGDKPQESNSLKRLRYTQTGPEDNPYLEKSELESVATFVRVSRMKINSGFFWDIKREKRKSIKGTSNNYQFVTPAQAGGQ